MNKMWARTKQAILCLSYRTEIPANEKVEVMHGGRFVQKEYENVKIKWLHIEVIVKASNLEILSEEEAELMDTLYE